MRAERLLNEAADDARATPGTGDTSRDAGSSRMACAGISPARTEQLFAAAE